MNANPGICLYLGEDLLNEVKAISNEYGVSVSRLARNGLHLEIERWHRITERDGGLRKDGGQPFFNSPSL